jgi:hypothetical protein
MPQAAPPHRVLVQALRPQAALHHLARVQPVLGRCLQRVALLRRAAAVAQHQFLLPLIVASQDAVDRSVVHPFAVRQSVADLLVAGPVMQSQFVAAMVQDARLLMNQAASAETVLPQLLPVTTRVPNCKALLVSDITHQFLFNIDQFCKFQQPMMASGKSQADWLH